MRIIKNLFILSCFYVGIFSTGVQALDERSEGELSFYLDSVEVIEQSINLKDKFFSDLFDDDLGFSDYLDVAETEVSQEADLSSINEPIVPTGDAYLDGLQILGKKTWKFIVDNQPELSATGHHAHIVPVEATDWRDLENWGRPQSKVIRAVYKNLFGGTVVDLSYRLIFTPHGEHQGTGQYLANVTVVPESVDVAWGYTLNASGQMYEVTNRGTKENPIASTQLQVNWFVGTIVKKSQSTQNFYIEGSGYSSILD